MKNIPPNVWRTRLHKTDWNFARCPTDELAACLNWELHRERAQGEARGTLPANPLTFIPSSTELRKLIANSALDPVRTRQISNVPKGWFYHPDFPQLSYLERRAKEGWKRIQYALTDKPSWLELDARGWDDLAYEVGNGPPIWLGGQANAEIVPLIIRWSWRDEDLTAAFRDWLKERRPKGEDWDHRPRVVEPPPKAKKKGGAGDPIRQAKVRLKALAAWRLIQHYKGDNFEAFQHPDAAEYLGKQFDKPGAWSEARATVQKTLKEFRFY